jgi:hypothetical protein
MLSSSVLPKDNLPGGIRCFPAPMCLATLQRHAKPRWYFSPERFTGGIEATAVHELALEPGHVHRPPRTGQPGGKETGQSALHCIATAGQLKFTSPHTFYRSICYSVICHSYYSSSYLFEIVLVALFYIMVVDQHLALFFIDSLGTSVYTALKNECHT